MVQTPIIRAGPFFVAANPKHRPEWIVSVRMPNCGEGYCRTFLDKETALKVVAHWSYWMPKATLKIVETKWKKESSDG